MIIDTHCHYNLKPLSQNIAKYWQEAQNNGIKATITIGTDLNNSKLALKIADKFSNIYAAIGLHPGNCTALIKEKLNGDQYSQDEINKLVDNNLSQFNQLFTTALNEDLKSKTKKIVAIGEIGLDYYHLRKKGLKRDLTMRIQKKTFEMQLSLAFKYNLVAIIHVRDQHDRFNNANNAYNDTLKIIERVIKNTKSNNPKFVLHCASGPKIYIKKALLLGSYIGIAGNITYNNTDDLKEIIAMTPSNRLLLETDAPYLIPESFKNNSDSNKQICEPFMIKATAEFLQQEMNINLDIITNNACKLFSI